jgi:hypothetical protein
VLDDRSPSFEQFVRQTDGARHIVSGDAELDGEPVSGIEHHLFLPGPLDPRRLALHDRPSPSDLEEVRHRRVAVLTGTVPNDDTADDLG